MGERRRGHGRGASRQAFQSGGAEGEGETLKKPHPSTPNGAGRGASPRPGTKRRGALAPVAASVLPHRRGRGRLILKGSGGPRRRLAAAGREGAALGPARPGAQRARRGEGRPPQRRARRPGPRPRRPPRLREKARRAGRRQRLQARSGGRAGGGARAGEAGGHRGPTQEGASRSLQREVGRAGRRS